jgi:DNA-binding HxlR family transcriptional regulator
MNNLETSLEIKKCPRKYVLAVNDTLNVISGKWKLPIIASLLSGITRFKDLLDNIEKITPRMLSKELKELEVNGVIRRKVFDTTPIRIEYTLTASGQNIVSVLDAMVNWGLDHRGKTFVSNDIKALVKTQG